MYISGQPSTSRDELIVFNALTAALPFMLLHSTEWSDLRDLMKIVGDFPYHRVGSLAPAVARYVALLETQGGPVPELVQDYLHNQRKYLSREIEIERRLRERLERQLDFSETNNKDLHRLYLNLYDSSLEYKKKKAILQSLLVDESWTWVVEGISVNSWEIFRANGFRKIPNTFRRHHFVPFADLANRLLRGEKLNWHDWMLTIKLGKGVHIITKEEHKSKCDYEFFAIDPELRLFQNQSGNFCFGESEKNLLESFCENTPISVQKFKQKQRWF